MNRCTWLTWLLSIVAIGTIGRAQASKIEISIRAEDRYLNGPAFHQYVEIVDGKLPEITAERAWVANDYGSGGSLSAPMTFRVRVTEWGDEPFEGVLFGNTIAEGTLTGQAEGWVGYRFATGHGTATFKDLSVDDRFEVPDWLPNLRIDVMITPADSSGDSYITTLTVSAVPVPEPGSAMIFLGAAGLGLLMHRRSRGRADVG